MKLVSLLFDPRGAIGRRAFALAMLGLYGVWWGGPFVLVMPAVIARDSRLGPPDSLVQLLALLQMTVLPYISLCLHLKRLQDAGRDVWSLVVMLVATLAAIPVAIAAALWRLQGQSSAENLNYPLYMIGFVLLAAAIVLLAWPLYGVWVGAARSKARPVPPKIVEQTL
jgi:uncharacterized membrane protein YhaH (DUF805 family)